MRLAKTFAAILQCLGPTISPDGEPGACGKCLPCRRVLAGSHPDVTFIRPLGNEIRIEQVRQMRDQAMLHPYLGKWRIFILDPADRLNESSANSLLKILEEAPDKVVFILIAEEIERILPTIQSRSEMIRFNHPSHKAARDTIVQISGLAPEVVARLYALTEGAFGATLALSSLETPIGEYLPLGQAQVRFLEDIEKFSVHVQEKVNEAPSLEAALSMFESPEIALFLPLLESRKSFVRGLLMAESLPAAFPVMFTGAFQNAIQRSRKSLEKVIETVISRQKSAYASEIIKDIDWQFGLAVQMLFQAQIHGLLDCLRHWCEDLFHFGHTGDETWLLNLDRKEDIMTLSQARGIGFAETEVQLLARILELQSRNVQPGLLLENVFSSIGGRN